MRQALPQLSDHSISKQTHQLGFNTTALWTSVLSSMHLEIFFTSTGVVSGTSLRIMMQRLWLGRTLSPVSSTCTMGEASRSTQVKYMFSDSESILMLPPKKTSTLCAVTCNAQIHHTSTAIYFSFLILFNNTIM